MSGVRKYVVARAQDVPEGGRLIVHVAGREIGVFNQGNEFFALLHRCPHLGGPLCQGDIVGLVYAPVPGEVHLDESRKLLRCPWHGWEFDIKTGQSYWNPQHTRARRFAVEVVSGDELADQLVKETKADPEARLPGPYIAETFPVELEDDYLVVALREVQ